MALLPAALLAGPASAGPDGPEGPDAPALAVALEGEFARGHVLFKLRPGRALEATEVPALGGSSIEPTSRVAPANAVLASQLGIDRWRTLRLAPGADAVAVVEALRLHPAVERASLDGIGGVAEVIPNDPSFTMQWPLANTGQSAGGVAGASGADIQAPAAWSLSTGGAQVIVAVLDSGVSDHPDLAGRILPGWNVPQGSAVTTDVCNSHGTHVSGIIGATGNNATAIAGLCWDVRIMPIVVVNPCTGLESWVADGIYWAVDHGAELINMSLQYSVGSDYLHDAVLYAAAEGVPMIAASGNSNLTPPAFPARWPETIAVAATNNLDQRWASSNYGAEIDVAAPGVAVLSLSASGGTTTKSGTSMAAPHVTGIVALMRSVHATIPGDEIRELLQSSAEDVDAPGFDQFTGWGRVNAAAAVQAAIDALPIPGDLDGNGLVNGMDLAIVLGQWGPCVACEACVADLDDDCVVGGADLAIVLGQWSAN